MNAKQVMSNAEALQRLQGMLDVLRDTQIQLCNMEDVSNATYKRMVNTAFKNVEAAEECIVGALQQITFHDKRGCYVGGCSRCTEDTWYWGKLAGTQRCDNYYSGYTHRRCVLEKGHTGEHCSK